MKSVSAYQFDVELQFKHQIHFTTNAFCCDNSTLEHVFISGGYEHKLLVFIEQRLLELTPQLRPQIETYISKKLPHVNFCGVVPLLGGESIKKDFSCVQAILDHIEAAGIERRSTTGRRGFCQQHRAPRSTPGSHAHHLAGTGRLRCRG